MARVTSISNKGMKTKQKMPHGIRTKLILNQWKQNTPQNFQCGSKKTYRREKTSFMSLEPSGIKSNHHATQ